MEGMKLYRQAKLLEATGRFRKTLELLRQAYPKAQYPQGHPDLAVGLNSLGVVLWLAGDLPAAQAPRGGPGYPPQQAPQGRSPHRRQPEQSRRRVPGPGGPGRGTTHVRPGPPTSPGGTSPFVTALKADPRGPSTSALVFFREWVGVETARRRVRCHRSPWRHRGTTTDTPIDSNSSPVLAGRDVWPFGREPSWNRHKQGRQRLQPTELAAKDDANWPFGREVRGLDPGQ